MPFIFGNEPEGDQWEMWLYGVIAPLPIAGQALLWIISRHADLQGRSRIVLNGSDAVALGLTTLCLALALHFQFFWGLNQNPTLRRYFVAGKALSMLGLLIGLLYLVWCLICLFIV